MCDAVRDARDSKEPQGKQGSSMPRPKSPDRGAPDRQPGYVECYENSDRELIEPEQRRKPLVESSQQLLGKMGSLKSDGCSSDLNVAPNTRIIIRGPASSRCEEQSDCSQGAENQCAR